jgi:large subunit ribosomal protein L29
VKTSELREKPDDELRGLDRDLRDELFRLRIEHHMNQLQDTAEIRRKRKTIARIKTILRERELDIE